MRNSSLNILRISCFILFITIFSCEKVDKPNHDNNEARAEMLTHIIPLANAFEMYDNYSKSRISLVKDTLKKMYGENFHDTRTVWFSIETLKEYIKYVEEESLKNKLKPEGFKICFSTYIATHTSDEKANHQSIFFVPTTEKKGRQAAYTIQGERGVLFLEDARSNVQQNTIKKEKAGFVSFSAAIQGNKGLIMNRGGGAPPPGAEDLDFK